MRSIHLRQASHSPKLCRRVTLHHQLFGPRRTCRGPCWVTLGACLLLLATLGHTSDVQPWAPGMEASKGQVWTRRCAPAAPAFTRPSSPSQFIACSTCHWIVHWLIVLLLTLPNLGKRQGPLVPGVIAGSRFGMGAFGGGVSMEALGHEQRILSSHIPPCHRHMVIATDHSSSEALGGGGSPCRCNLRPQTNPAQCPLLLRCFLVLGGLGATVPFRASHSEPTGESPRPAPSAALAACSTPDHSGW